MQVQPDMEELTENAEEPDDGDSKKEEQKLGKLLYKVGDQQARRQDRGLSAAWYVATLV